MITLFVVIGCLCVVGGALGGGIEIFGNKMDKPATVVRSVLVFAVGVGFLFAAWRIHTLTRLHVTDAVITWDFLDTGSGVCEDEPYTLQITTDGSAAGEVKYRLVINNRPQDPETISTPIAKTYAITGKAPIEEGAEDGAGVVSLRVDVLEPSSVKSESDQVQVKCDYDAGVGTSSRPATVTPSPSPPVGSEDLKQESSDFLKAYDSAVNKYGRSSSEVLGNFYSYPLTWYRAGTFKDSGAFLKYIEEGRARAAGRPKTAPRCTYTDARVISATRDENRTVVVVTEIDWKTLSGSAKGQTLVTYNLVEGSDGQFRIESVGQDSYSSACD